MHVPSCPQPLQAINVINCLELLQNSSDTNAYSVFSSSLLAAIENASHATLELGLARQGLKLLRSLAFDWHLIKAKDQTRLAAMVCSVLASAFRSGSDQLESCRSDLLRSGSSSGQNMIRIPMSLRCGHVWALIEPSMVWWQRLLSGMTLETMSIINPSDILIDTVGGCHVSIVTDQRI